ncbi:CocE/NonD family hydrolase [Pseudoalteromonas luteoviolacea]|uniref:CocE/NonD family hydrolase n=1 Tax=Pseudoalteromonas luteoviolacea TaxID=43657 RepID=UPI001B371208|nr:CocE/NonD family hydrolase [Pseudoalteromonas luteoviolacea]MBQ4837605.1 CocE/NonD family hydrolase [Pseudoalteromonas luteoviolacea]
MYFVALLIVLSSFQLMALEVKDLRIPVRDKTELAATIYTPTSSPNRDKKFPVIVQFTPYGKSEAQQRGRYFSKHGYIFVAVDSRGLGESNGVFTPFIDEGRDGYDVIEYLAKLPMSNGLVGTLGGSYRGFAQWAIQKYRPPSLQSMIAIASVYPGYDFPMGNNIFSDYTISWLDFVLSNGQNKRYGNGDRWQQTYLRQKNSGTRFKDFDKNATHLSDVYQTWLAHPSYDEYWQTMVPKQQDYAAITTPILSITGHYDGDQRGTLRYFKNHQQWGNQLARSEHYLIVGPWDHSGTRKPKSHVHEAYFLPPSMLDMFKIHLDWFNWTLKGEAKPAYLDSLVMHYIQASGLWVGQTHLKSGSDVEHLPLQSLQIQGEVQTVSRYRYDPTKPIALPMSLDMTGSVNLPSEYEGYVIFETKPLDRDKVLFGRLEAEVWLTMNVADSDFYLDAFEVCTNSRPRLLSKARKRAKYRDSLTNPVSTPSNVPFLIKFKDFDWVARNIEKGCKLQFVIRSSQWHRQKHFNSALPVAFQTMKQAHVADIQILHQPQYPSYITIPWLKPGDVGKPVVLPLSL